MTTDPVNHPAHYTEGFPSVNIECIDITRYLDFCLGNAFKYVWRAGKKGEAKALEDLDKALWYVDERRTLRTYDHSEIALYLFSPIWKLNRDGWTSIEKARVKTLHDILECPNSFRCSQNIVSLRELMEKYL